MKKVEGYCLYDITPTRVIRVGNDITPEKIRQRNQQRNWETILQLIGLRTQPFNIKVPVLIDGKNTPFPEAASVWFFTFDIEHSSQWLVDNDPFWVLKVDCENTPMLTGLSESEELTPLINTFGDNINLTFC